jgi:hypothetical protein
MSSKSCKENKNTHFTFSNFFSENRAVYEIMSKYVVELERPQMTMAARCMLLDEQGYTHVKHTHAFGHSHARTRAEAHIRRNT